MPPPRRVVPLVLAAVVLMWCAARSAAGQNIVTDVPVPGGIVAFTGAIGVPPIEPASFVAEVSRILTSEPLVDRGAPESKASRLRRYLRDRQWSRAATGISQEGPARVPMPLSPSIWSAAVFRRPVTDDNLVAAIVGDARALLLARGLTGLDDEGLASVAARPDVLRRLYERHAAVFASFTSRVRVRGGCIVPPGGQEAVVLWEEAVHARLCSPATFIAALMSNGNGRIAYLYDLIGHLEPGRVRFALGLGIDNPAERLARFNALAEFAVEAFPEWHATRTPHVRPVHDLLSLFMRVHVTPEGRPDALQFRAFWTQVLSPRAAPAAALHSGPLVDAAWLAQMLLAGLPSDRSERLDQFGFGQRVFGNVATSDADDARLALEGFARYPMLLLTLERMGVRPPAVYAQLVRSADNLSGLDRRDQPTAMALFQGAVAIVARLVRTTAIDRATAETLLSQLAQHPVNADPRAALAWAMWFESVDQVLPSGPNRQSRLLAGMVGGSSIAPRRIAWEGAAYVVDLDDAERRRLAHFWSDERRPTIDDVLAQARVTPAATVARGLADTLVALVYAGEVSNLPDPSRVPRGLAARHDLGLSNASRRQRELLPWSLPRSIAPPGTPWRVQGALLGLDIALAALALQRMNEPPAAPPVLGGNERLVFVLGASTFEWRSIREPDMDEIAAAVARGRARVERLAIDREDVDRLADAVGLDGWRRRALVWATAHQPQPVALWTLTELFVLGGGQLAVLAPWGQWSRDLTGCLCREAVPPQLVPALAGRWQTGLLAVGVADLQLRVALVTRELGLPAALAGALLTFAVQEFFDRVAPTDANDWLTLVSGAQRLSRERIEDYVAATAGRERFAPLVAAARE